MGVTSTEDEDDMPYDMYTNDAENRRSLKSPDDKESNEGREEVGQRAAEVIPEETTIQENTITNLVRTSCNHLIMPHITPTQTG